MLSKQAFNALLKTLEEPPEYLKFIFATTEIKKIPITVVSRCQRFDLSRIKSQELFNFIKEIKSINPDTEIIIYVYSPVPTEGSELYDEITRQGFHFPEKLDEWLAPSWEKFDQRKNPLTPWLTADMIDNIKNFETVLNEYYPTCSDFRIKGWKKKLLKSVASWRYKTGFYHFPYEIKLLHKIWKYRQPEEQGFYTE